MKKLFIIMSVAAMALSACGSGGEAERKPQPLTIDNRLTDVEKQAGVLTPEVMWKMGRVGGAALSQDGSRLLYTVTSYNMAENRGVTVIWLMDMSTGESRALTDTASNNTSPQWLADGRIAFLSDRSGSNQVWSMCADGSQVRQLSKTESDIEGFGFAPDLSRAFYVVRTHVKDILSADKYADMDKSKARVYDDLMCRHWDYWDDGSYLHLYVAEVSGDGLLAEGRDIMGGDAAWDAPLAPYFDMGEIAWSNDSKMLAYTCKPLTGAEYATSTDSDIFVYFVESDATQNICKPAGVASRAHDLPGYDKYPVWSPDDRYIAFRSQRRPGNEADKERLFLYDCRTAQMRDLTERFDYNATEVKWEDGEHILFIATYQGTHQICRVDLQGNVELLTSGDHDITAFTMAGGRVVASMNTMSKAAELYAADLSTGGLTQLTDINGEIYDNIRMGRVEKRWITTTDGKQMLTWVILPPDFDPATKYPTLLYCEGGPQSVVSQFWSYRWNFQLMAARGYVVVAPNRRGCPSFGQEWVDQISGDYSGQNIRDYLSAIDTVSREPWVDNDRRGCVGASYGGYSVFYLAGVHENRFKAFIAHCGIFDFESMYGHTEELFFVNNDYGGAYWDKQNATAQRSYANSPHKLVERWNTPIMIITGEKDFRIPYTQSLEAFTAARLHGLDSRLVVFENEAHQVFKPQNSLVWNREFFGWLDKYLK
ncbi:MAG: S9 family peptidase [Alistipes sp.]|nr:S9 family peptidase [Alistipes sp.]